MSFTDILAINTSSFHYKYYQLLRRIWNFGEKTDRTSLCIYTQFLFWFSLWTLFCSPCILGGWILLKTGRSIYKVCSWTKTGRKILDVLDSLGMGNKIDELSREMEQCPALSLSMTFLKFCLFACIGTFIIALFIGGMVYIKTICMVIIAVLMMIGLICFYACFGIGWGIAHFVTVIYIGIKWFVLFLAGYAFFIGMFLVSLAVAALAGMIMLKIITASDRLMEFLGFQLNGYHKARTEISNRRAENKKKREEALQKLKEARWDMERKKENGEVPYTLGERFRKWAGKTFKAGGEKLGEFFVARSKNVGNGTVKVVSGFGVVWLTLKAFKQGICPLVEFVDEERFNEEGLE